MTFYCLNLFAQTESLIEDESLLTVEEVVLLNKLDSIGIEKNLVTIQGDLNNKVQNLLSDLNKLNTHLNEQILASVSLDNFFTSGDTTFIANQAQGLNSNMRFNSTLDIASIPIKFSGNFWTTNFEPNFQNSSISISFDKDAFQNRIVKNKISELKNHLKKADDIRSILNDGNKELYVNEIKYEFWQSIASSNELTEKMDSLIFSKRKLNKSILEVESLTSTKKDSLLVQYDKQLQNIDEHLLLLENVKKYYFKYRDAKSNFNHKQIKELHNELTVYSKELNGESLLNSEIVSKTGSAVSKVENILLDFEKFNIGLFSIQDDNVVENLVLTGANISYDFDGIILETAYGSQSLNSSFFPAFSSLVMDRYNGRRYVYFNAKNKEEYLNTSIGLTYLKVAESNDPLLNQVTFPKTNTVIGFSAETSIWGNINFRLNSSLSNKYLGNSAFFESNGMPLKYKNSSYSVGLAYKENSFSEAEIGYFYNGPDYFNLGNPFFLQNSYGIFLKSNLSFLKRKNLNLKFDVKVNKNNPNNNNFDFQNSQLLAEISYRFKRGTRIVIKYMPNIYLQTSTSTPIESFNDIFSLQFEFKNKINNSILNSIVQATNFRTDLQIIDSLTFDTRVYAYSFHNLILSESQSISLANMIGMKDRLNSMSDFSSRLSYSQVISLWRITMGVEMINHFKSEYWQYGLIGRITTPFFKSGISGYASINYRDKINGFNSKDGNYLLASFGMNYIFKKQNELN